MRTADESNPEGYFELEAVKHLDKAGRPAQADALAWLADARGKAVKVVAPLLRYLPETNNYRVILMQRPLDEVVTSQNTMLARAGEATDVVPAAASSRNTKRTCARCRRCSPAAPASRR